MPDLRDSKFRKELLGKLDDIPEYVRPEVGARANGSVLFKLVREYEETSFFSKFLARFGVVKAARIEKEFNTSALNNKAEYDDVLKVLNLGQSANVSSNSAVQEYLTSDLEPSKQTMKGAAETAPAPLTPHKNVAQPDMLKSAKPNKISPIYDKFLPIPTAPVTPTQFFEAVKSGNIVAVKEMLENEKFLAKATDEKGYTPLHWVVNKEVAALLIANGADVNAKANDKTQPIEWAKNNKELKDFLKDKGGRPHLPERKGHVGRLESSAGAKVGTAIGALKL